VIRWIAKAHGLALGHTQNCSEKGGRMLNGEVAGRGDLCLRPTRETPEEKAALLKRFGAVSAVR
jgi:hypothetical protein